MQNVKKTRVLAFLDVFFLGILLLINKINLLMLNFAIFFKKKNYNISVGQNT